MAPTSSVSSSSEAGGEPASTKLAASLAGLPVRVPGQQDGLEQQRAADKGEHKGLEDTLDLAVRSLPLLPPSARRTFASSRCADECS